MRISVLIFLLFICSKFQAQSLDSLAMIDSLAKADSVAQAKERRKQVYYSPRKATIMSAILPGLGQAYNKKYWKIPVIYAAIGGFGYAFYTNNGNYNDFRGALIRSQEDSTGQAVVGGAKYYTEDLQTMKLMYKKQRDLCAIAITVVYLLNIIDANVDAHLRTFDVSDDLSLRLDPWISPSFTGYSTAGLSLTLKFKK